MEKFIITTGKSVDDAINVALEQLKLDRESVSVEVLRIAKKGLFGIGSTPAEVKVTYEAPDEAPAAPKTALSSASRTAKPKERIEPTSSVISRPGKKIEPEKKPEKPATAEKKPQPEKKPAPAEKKPQAEKKAPVEKKPQPQKKAPVEAAPVEEKVYAPAAEGSVEAQIETFLAGLLKHMSSEAVPHAYKVDEETYRVDLVGGDAGLLIGRRGDTLDAIQYLTGYVINRERDKRLRINVDAGSYRRKREEALQQLANKMAAKAVKYHRNFTLEPMNAYERHVIHAALQEYPQVTTFSTGTEPHRRIVVAYAKEK
ncbi:MAG: Jag N-terminal domain-containing protein [Oscillospiraceae bacterium]|nr:Jag N-terminal domain-containing protein [Oscillospiraceae bacterium]